MKYNFDEEILRKDTDSLKYDSAVSRGMPEKILPLWVADMDFRTPPCVIDALVEKSRHGIFGYSETGRDYTDILTNWFSQNFDWKIDPKWLVMTPGIVYAICTAIRSLTSKGDAVLIQPPVYYPFSEAVRDNERTLVTNQLVYQDGKYCIDFDDFEKKIREHKVKLFILCSPHNPVGRVWTRDELIRMGDICLKYNVTVVADEIHSDFIYPGNKHLVFAALKPEFNDMTITCTSPTKTFNLAGLQISNIFIPDSDIRRKFATEIAKSGYSQLNIAGITACKAAYSEGHDWLEQLRDYLTGNLNFIRDFLRERLPKVKLVEPEGTYLIWLDCRDLNLNDKELDELIVHKAGLWLDAGPMFGPSGEGFQRVNIACPRSVLEKALISLENALVAL